MKKTIKKIFLSTVIFVTFNNNSYADTIGFEAGYALWNPDISGSITYNHTKKDIPTILGIDNYDTGFVWVSLEHPLPLIPNIKIQNTKLEENSDSKRLYLTQTDFILYYELLENWINLDIGINLKQFDGEVATSEIDKTSFSGIIPLGYLKAKFDLPFTGFSIEADISSLSIGDSSISDLKAGVLYESEIGFGGVLGYRKQNIKLDDLDDVSSDITLKSPYFGIYYHF